MRRDRAEAWGSEAEMCAAFVTEVGRIGGWTVYPEHWGDMLLVRDEDGFQIGVEAKLRLNVDVICQIAEGVHQRLDGPDCRAVLVPGHRDGFSTICALIGITVICIRPHSGYSKAIINRFSPDLPTTDTVFTWHNRDWFELCPVDRVRLPEYVPDVTPGRPSPIRLTDWKIRALKLCVLLEKTGYLTRADFKRMGVDIRGWISPHSKWLLPSNGQFVAGPGMPWLQRQHPDVYAKIAADEKAWQRT